MNKKAIIVPMFSNKKKSEILFLLFQRFGDAGKWGGLKDDIECEADSYENCIDFLLEATKGTIGEKKTLMKTKPFFTVNLENSTSTEKNIYYFVKMDLCEKYATYLNNSLRHERRTHKDDLKEVRGFTIGEIISLGSEKGDEHLKCLLLEDLHKFRSGLH